MPLSNIAQRVVRKYQKDGAFSVLKKGAEISYDNSVKVAGKSLCSKYLEEYSITHSDLQRKYTTYSMPEEEPFVITHDPNFSTEQKHAFENVTGEYRPTQRVAYDITDGILTSNIPMPFTPAGQHIQVFTDRQMTCINHDKLGGGTIGYFRTVLKPTRGSIKSEYDELFLLTYHGDQNLYNWIHWFLPQIRTLEHIEQTSGMKPKILLQRNPPSWMTESLEYFGIDLERCVHWSGQPVSAKHLLVPNLRAKNTASFDISKEDVEWLREKAGVEMTSANERRHERIYISRQNSSYRYVDNFSEVSKILETHGFRTYRLEEMSFTDQIRLFKMAQSVVAVHGAGLANTLFSPENTDILELVPDSRVAEHFFLTSRLVGHHYNTLWCSLTNSGGVTVDTEKLDSVLQTL